MTRWLMLSNYMNQHHYHDRKTQQQHVDVFGSESIITIVDTIQPSLLINTIIIILICLLALPVSSNDPLLKPIDKQNHHFPLEDNSIQHRHQESSSSSSSSSYLSDVIENEAEVDLPISNLCDKNDPNGASVSGIRALGMESEQIPDSALTASSAFEMLHVGPQNARLNKDKSGGAWCPSKQLGPDTSGNEWIQVDLGRLHVVTGVATQGRYGKGLGQEFTESYNILYSRQIIPTKWIKWKSLDGRSNLEGNIDPNTVEEHHLELPMVGVRHIRIVPLSNHTRTVCLRFELFGCLYQGPISYTLPATHHETLAKENHLHLLDLSYDGSLSDTGNLFGGLGQLTDGIKPSKHDHVKSPEFLWVGWPRMNGSLKMLFEFEQVYNFTSISLNCRNNFSKNVKAFSTSLIWFSLDNEHWSHSAIGFEYQTDNVIELPRDITIPLQHRIGQFIRIELIYQSEWLQLSEVTFDCHPLPSNLTLDQKSKLFEWSHSAAYNDGLASGGTRYVMSDDNNAFHNNHSSNFTKHKYPIGSETETLKYSLIIACLCTLGLVILSLLTSFIFRKGLNLRKNNVFTEMSDGDLESENAAINMKNLPKEDGSPLYCNPKEISSIQDEAEYAIPDVICPSNLSKTLHLQNKQTQNSMACKTLQINPRFYASSDIIHPKQNIYGTRLGQPIRNLLDIGNFRSTNLKNSQLQNQTNKHHQQTPLLDTFSQTNMVTSGAAAAAAGLFNPTTIRSTFYGDVIDGTFGVRIYSESEIGVLQSLGKSKYGDVLLCNIPAAGKNRLAIVRTVNDLSLKNEFVKSMDYMRKLSQQKDHFARLLGIIETPTYFASIIEHGDCDLNYFLRKSNVDILSFDVLLYIASQIANGCIYLETFKQIHQDLATRNVIVYEKSLTVKITDGASFLNKYCQDYYNGLPIRWMSPESIVRSEFTTESEVYSFGVCLWEILTYGKCRPFVELTDEELLASVYSYMNHEEEMIRLARPPLCTNEIFDLLQECTDPNETQRPTFKEISLFLQRKTLAFPKPIPTTITTTTTKLPH